MASSLVDGCYGSIDIMKMAVLGLLIATGIPDRHLFHVGFRNNGGESPIRLSHVHFHFHCGNSFIQAVRLPFLSYPGS